MLRETIAVPLWIRPHLVPPTTATMVISRSTLDGINIDGEGLVRITTHTDPGDWILTNQTVDAHGRAPALPSWFGDCLPPPGAAQSGSGTPQEATGFGALDACFSRLTDEGYRQRLVYQAHSHFWRLQWAEFGLYLAASAILTALSFRWTRHRLS